MYYNGKQIDEKTGKKASTDRPLVVLKEGEEKE